MREKAFIRIISGKFNGRRLSCPPLSKTRPTSDRSRQGVFNILEHQFNISWPTSTVADICAGSGSMGLEALSRGAAHVDFVENYKEVAQILKENLAILNLSSQSNLILSDARTLGRAKLPYKVIFLDPPYNQNLEIEIVPQLIKQNWMDNESLLCLETESTKIPTEISNLKHSDFRKYGKNGFSFWVLEKMY
jgi:16S rRNA (guanine966-N2)-methyltransferase